MAQDPRHPGPRVSKFFIDPNPDPDSDEFRKITSNPPALCNKCFANQYDRKILRLAEQSQGPCYRCMWVAWQDTIYSTITYTQSKARECAERFEALAQSGFKLAEEVRRATACGSIERAELERMFSVPLAQYRATRSEAVNAAQIPENPKSWIKIPEGAILSEFNIGPIIENDPTKDDIVVLDNIHKYAGYFAVASRQLIDHSQLFTDMPDKDAFALSLIKKFHIHPPTLAKLRYEFSVGENGMRYEDAIRSTAARWRKQEQRNRTKERS